MEKKDYKREYYKAICDKVASEAWGAICATTDRNVIRSWGIQKMWGGIVTNNNVTMACLILDVDALIHRGSVTIAYNDGADLYEIQLRKGDIVGEWHTGIYCDQLGATIDSLIEKPLDMDDDVYRVLSMLDSYIKCGF